MPLRPYTLLFLALAGCPYELPADTDTSLNDTGSDTATDTGTGTDTATGSDTGSDTATGTDSGTDTATGTDTGSDSATDSPPGPRHILPGDGCLGEPTLGSGSYYGTLAWNLNDISSLPCVGDAGGRDGSVLVSVPAGATLTATYTSLAGDGVLYLLDRCPVVSSCLAGADNNTSGAETVSWTNTDGAPNDVHVVLDNWELAGSEAFELVIELR